jgi:hypothetical protein
MRINKQILRFISFLPKQLGWIRDFVNPGVAPGEFDFLIHSIFRVFKTRGIDAGIAYVKAIRGNLLNYLSGNPIRIPGVRVTSSGLPKALGPLVKYIEKGASPALLQFVLTILFSTRSLKSRPELKIQPIEDPSKRSESSLGFGSLSRDFWRELGYLHKGHIPRRLRFRRFHFTTKTGPFGHALASWVDDLLSLPNQLTEAIKTLGGVKLTEFIDAALANKDILMGLRQEYKLVKSGYPLRRLSYFADKEGKSRVIAIMDYFSQTVLKGLHSYLFSALRKIPQDMTFNQGAFKARISDWEVFYSVDLSSATDRFPIDLISDVLKGHLPSEYVEAWKHIMVGYPFKVPGEDRLIYYSVGNPMGAYSSWASFAIAHHYLFYMIAREQNKSWKTLKYVLLGDDILIGDDEVGRRYLEVINALGVDVSLAKTHISKTTCEFAKRWIHKGVEISPVPISALKGVGKKYYLLTSFLMQLEEKGYVIDSYQKVVQAFFSKIYPHRRSFRRTLGDKAYIVEQIIRIIWGGSAAYHLNEISKALKIPLTIVSDITANKILGEVSLTLFNQSDPTRSSGGKPLGLLAENLVIYLTGLLEERPEAMTFLENPTLHAYGSIESSYLDLIKMTRSGEFVGATGQWPLVLKSMAVPLSDELFISRESDVNALGASRIGKMVEQALRDNLSLGGYAKEILY